MTIIVINNWFSYNAAIHRQFTYKQPSPAFMGKWDWSNGTCKIFHSQYYDLPQLPNIHKPANTLICY